MDQTNKLSKRHSFKDRDDRAAFEILFRTKYAVSHHRAAPLASERECYMQHLINQKMSHKGLRDTAALLLHVVRVLEITTPRTVHASEIKAAAKDWANESLAHRKSSQCQSAIRFNTAAKGWLRFQGLLKLSQPFLCHFDVELTAFTAFLVDELGYCASTIAGIKGPTARFLFWAAASHDRLSSISYRDLDSFMDQGRAKGWRPATVRCYCLALRTFFRYAEKQGWCKLGLWRAIVSPVVRVRDSEVSGPAWRDIRVMIKNMTDSSPVDCRDRAILLLCSVYGLRNTEITHLKLEDIDWYSETLVVKRAKRGGWQRFPMQPEVGDAIIRYLKTTRPRCSHRNLFLTLGHPYRPLTNLSCLVQKHMRNAGIKSQKYGTHSIRHACATELLRKGTSLQNIAAYLGHRDIRSVSIYAKYDLRSLCEVANFSLSEVL